MRARGRGTPNGASASPLQADELKQTLSSTLHRAVEQLCCRPPVVLREGAGPVIDRGHVDATAGHALPQSRRRRHQGHKILMSARQTAPLSARRCVARTSYNTAAHPGALYLLQLGLLQHDAGHGRRCLQEGGDGEGGDRRLGNVVCGQRDRTSTCVSWQSPGRAATRPPSALGLAPVHRRSCKQSACVSPTTATAVALLTLLLGGDAHNA